MEPAVPVDMTAFRPARNEDAPRRAHLTKEFFKEHGYTVGCEGCRRLEAGMAKTIVHTEQCRKRMEETMRGMVKGRKWLEKSDAKIAEYMEKTHDDKEKAEKKRRVEEPSTREGQVEGPSTLVDPVVGESSAVETPLELKREDKDAEEDKQW